MQFAPCYFGLFETMPAVFRLHAADPGAENAQLLRTSVALNNRAAALFEDQKYLEAHLVLRDTLALLRQWLVARRGLGLRDLPPEYLPLALDPCVALNRAKANASRLRPQPLSLPLPVRVVSDDSFDLPNEPASSLIHETFWFVRIEVNESIEAVDEDSVLASVAYNYGLSFLCLARLSSSPQRGEKLKENAVKIFRVAKRFVSCGSPCSPLPGLLLVGALLARATFQTLVQLGNYHQARQCLQLLKQFEITFEANRLLFQPPGAMSPCHKAAAA
jgi:hypothetical protein